LTLESRPSPTIDVLCKSASPPKTPASRLIQVPLSCASSALGIQFRQVIQQAHHNIKHGFLIYSDHVGNTAV
jgi:hypothetical protein